MPRITATISEAQYQHLEQRAEELDRSMSEVTRLLVQEDIDSDVLNSDATYSDVTNSEVKRLEDRLRELEQRVSNLESEPEGVETDTDATESELIEYVQGHQPVSKSDIIDACYPQDSPLNERSWWDTRAREELKDAGYSYTRNVGWQLE